jgi:hypothetical protein
VSTATPDKVMNPTPAEMDSGMSRSHSAAMPPVSASGTPLKTSSASFADPNVIISSAKINSRVSGVKSCKRLAAD